MSPTLRFALLLLAATACTDPGPELDVETPLVAFGSVPCATSAARTVSIRNIGEEEARVTVSSTLATFSVEPADVTLAPGARRELTAIARVTATTSASEGVLGFAIFPSPYIVKRIPARFEPAGVRIRSEATEVDFGAVSAGTTATRQLELIAEGAGTTRATLSVPSEFEVVSPTSFDVTAGSRPRIDLRLRASGTPRSVTGVLFLRYAEGPCAFDKSVSLRGSVAP